MTDDAHHSADAEDRSDEDYQQAVEACQHAADTLSNGDLARAGRCSMKRRRPSSAPSTTTANRPIERLPITATSNRFTSSATDTGTGTN
jgi:hypothetical protein